MPKEVYSSFSVLLLRVGEETTVGQGRGNVRTAQQALASTAEGEEELALLGLNQPVANLAFLVQDGNHTRHDGTHL